MFLAGCFLSLAGLAGLILVPVPFQASDSLTLWSHLFKFRQRNEIRDLYLKGAFMIVKEMNHQVSSAWTFGEQKTQGCCRYTESESTGNGEDSCPCGSLRAFHGMKAHLLTYLTSLVLICCSFSHLFMHFLTLQSTLRIQDTTVDWGKDSEKTEAYIYMSIFYKIELKDKLTLVQKIMKSMHNFVVTSSSHELFKDSTYLWISENFCS